MECAELEWAEVAGSMGLAPAVDTVGYMKPGGLVYMVVPGYSAWLIVVVGFGCGRECLV